MAAQWSRNVFAADANIRTPHEPASFVTNCRHFMFIVIIFFFPLLFICVFFPFESFFTMRIRSPFKNPINTHLETVCDVVSIVRYPQQSRRLRAITIQYEQYNGGYI